MGFKEAATSALRHNMTKISHGIMIAIGYINSASSSLLNVWIKPPPDSTLTRIGNHGKLRSVFFYIGLTGASIFC